ncbi:unnamed protein product [Periconia digitata]|uniref:Uncharacterized protein n=1 Tax=Periconia digitata TaxID=1303443 RepID=A0A9W4XQI2_9PLEO|nr:unnamed protein product [Periconia digitata]
MSPERQPSNNTQRQQLLKLIIQRTHQHRFQQLISILVPSFVMMRSPKTLPEIPSTWPSVLVNPSYAEYTGAHKTDKGSEELCTCGCGQVLSSETIHNNGSTGGSDVSGQKSPLQPQLSDLYYRLASFLECQIYMHNQTRNELVQVVAERDRYQKGFQRQNYDLTNWAKTCHNLYETLNSSRQETRRVEKLLEDALNREFVLAAAVDQQDKPVATQNAGGSDNTWRVEKLLEDALNREFVAAGDQDQHVAGSEAVEQDNRWHCAYLEDEDQDEDEDEEM